MLQRGIRTSATTHAEAGLPRRAYRGGPNHPEAGLSILRRAYPSRGGPIYPEAGLLHANLGSRLAGDRGRTIAFDGDRASGVLQERVKLSTGRYLNEKTREKGSRGEPGNRRNPRRARTIPRRARPEPPKGSKGSARRS